VALTNLIVFLIRTKECLDQCIILSPGIDNLKAELKEELESLKIELKGEIELLKKERQ